MSVTINYGFPLLPANSAQPEVPLNLAINAIDAQIALSAGAILVHEVGDSDAGGSCTTLEFVNANVEHLSGGRVRVTIATDSDVVGGGGITSDTDTRLDVRVASFANGTSAIVAPTNDVTIVIAEACVIEKIVALGLGGAGSCAFDVKRSTYSAFPSASSIVASAPPTISAAQKASDSTLTGWTTALAAGDILTVSLASCSTFKFVQLALHLRK